VPITLNFTIINPESVNNMQLLGTLSAPVGADIKFNLLNVEGFQDTICLAQFDSGEYDNTGGLVTNIAEGDSGGYSAIPTSYFGWWNNNTPSSFPPLSYRFLPPTINGTLLTTSPQTIVIGGDSVEVNWADCVNTQLATTTTTTSTTTEEPTTTSTTTSTTTAGIQAEIEFLFYNNGLGNIYAQANVTSGVTIDNLLFNLIASTGYQSSGCIGTNFSASQDFTLISGLTTNQVNIAGFNGNSVVSAQVNVSGLQVEGNTINTVSQTITVGGNNYLITGATNCFETP
jgi:hypothetical protein